MQHKFSNEISTHGKLSTEGPIEEGFADVFSEDCLNYFLSIEPELISDFANNIGMRFDGVREYSSYSMYIGERKFIKTILEAIRQINGKYHDAEFEYVFGNKDKFMEIVKDALGDECLELIIQQNAEGRSKLGENYNESNLDKLYEILKNVPLEISTDNNENETGENDELGIIKRIAKRQELIRLSEQKGIDIFNLTPQNLKTFKIILDVMKFDDEKLTYEILQGYLKNSTKSSDLNELFIINTNFRDIFINKFSSLLETTQFQIVDILELIGGNIKNTGDLEQLVLTNQQIEQISYEISRMNMENLTEEQIRGVTCIAAKCHNPNKNLFEFLAKVNEEQLDNLGVRLEVEIARIKVDGENFRGSKLAQIITKYRDTYVADPKSLLYNTGLEYLEKHAKNDSMGLKELIDVLKTIDIDGKLERDESVSKIEFICDVLKQDLIEFLKKDIDTIKKELINTGYISSTDVMKKIADSDFFGALDSISDGINIYNPNVISRLLSCSKKTQIVNLFDENIIAQVLNGRVCENAECEYEIIGIEAREKYLNVLLQILESDASGIENIIDIKNLCSYILPYDIGDDIEKSEEMKSAFIVKIREFIGRRKSPIEDLIELYQCKIPAEYRFIYDELINNFENMLREGTLGEISEDSIKNLSFVASKNERIQNLLLNLLKKQYEKNRTTTEQFLKNAPSFIKRGTYLISTAEREKEYDYIEMRTNAYLDSLGKKDDSIHKQSLLKMQELKVDARNADVSNVKAPQYITYTSKDNLQKFVIVGYNQDGEFLVGKIDTERDFILDMKSEAELTEQQNKGKKGLRGLFKKKKEKEIITESIILEEKVEQSSPKVGLKTIQVLNRYENGRLEISTLIVKGNKVKTVSREDINPQDIGNNGGMVIKEALVERVAIDYDDVLKGMSKGIEEKTLEPESFPR